MAKKKNNTQALVVIVLLVLMGIVAIFATQRLTNPQALNTPSRADEMAEYGQPEHLPCVASIKFDPNNNPTPEVGQSFDKNECSAEIECTGPVKKFINTDALKCSPPSGGGPNPNLASCTINKEVIPGCMSLSWWEDIAGDVCGCTRPTPTPTWYPYPTKPPFLYPTPTPTPLPALTTYPIVTFTPVAPTGIGIDPPGGQPQ